MSTYARIYDGKVAEIFVSDENIADLFSPDLIWVDVSDLSPLPVEGWVASKETSGWVFGQPAADAVNLVSSALAALEASDRVVLRCYENAVAVPSAWSSYRKSLRAIANGTDETSLAIPSQPAYPSGT